MDPQPDLPDNPKTVLGIEEKIEAVLAYALTWVTGILFLLIEKENKFVRFHAMQSVITFLPLFIISVIPIIGWFFSIFIIPVTLILWLFLMYKAYLGEKYKLPMVGDFAEKQVEKVG